MDNVNNLNEYLKTLELKDSVNNNNNNNNNIVHNTSNISNFSRDLLLNNSNINVNVANPQRFFMENRNTTNNSVNEKINDYNFIQKKNFKPNLDLNFNNNK